MKIYRPLWNEGAFLSPQQFQQQANWENYTNNLLSYIAVGNPWGLLNVSIDESALSINRLHIEVLSLRFRDGTVYDSSISDLLPNAKDLSSAEFAGETAITVYAAIPLIYSNGENVLLENENTSVGEETQNRPKRYRQEWKEVQDLFGSERDSISVERLNLSLRFSTDDNSNYLTCPIARLRRDSSENWRLDTQYIPPVMSYQASTFLCEQLNQISIQVNAKRSHLMGMRRENNERMADFAVADVSLFWLLNALNTHEASIKFFIAHTTLHPEFIYRELVQLAGALLTFSLEHGIDAIPAYNHEEPEKVFPPLFSLIRLLLEASLPSRVIAIDIRKVTPNKWHADIHDPRLKNNVDYYLSVRSSLPAHQLLSLFPQLCKIGSPDDVNNIVNVALQGVPIMALSNVPAAIPMRLDNHYFTLDLTHQSAVDMLNSGVCAFYIPSSLPDIQLELYAVLRQ